MQINAFIVHQLRLWRFLIPTLVSSLCIYVVVEMKYPLSELADLLLWVSRMDPFLLIVYIGSTLTVPNWAWLTLLVMLSAALAGRVFCGWLCPLGGLLGFVQYCTGRVNVIPSKFARRILRLSLHFEKAKYWWLAAVLVIVGSGFSTILLLAPSALLSHEITRIYYGQIPWIIAVALLLGIIFYPRFWCANICPTGILFSLVAKLRSAKIHVGDECTECGHCKRSCPVGTDITKLGEAGDECLVCGRCWSGCSQHAMRWSGQPKAKAPRVEYKEARRNFIKASASILVGSLFYFSASRLSSVALAAPILRPPGAIPESDFLSLCNRCNRCIKVCPNSALEPLAISSGISAFGTPKLIPRKGRCELCMLCGRVCPTGAIQIIKAEEAKIGIAVLDRQTCLAWEKRKMCLICKEQCPVNAVVLDDRKRPYVDSHKCVGCGACENACPLDEAAIKIISI